MGKLDLSSVTYCRIVNTLELAHTYVSETLVPALSPEAVVVSEPFDAPFDANGDFARWSEAAVAAGGKPVEAGAH